MIYIAASRNGYRLKEEMLEYLKLRGYKVEDWGPDNDTLVEYPDLARLVAEKVAGNHYSRGILFSGKGTGMCIAANKVKNVSAAVVFTPSLAEKTRLEDNSNVLCLPSLYISSDVAKEIIATWLSTSFSGSDYNVRCIKKIRKMENDA
ncbi:MAG: hypothetical protein A2722_01810 [Candidatus Doudnabacteria bacterium RIFCSPHIGHO2_01_FULL_50_11]|uniref:Ribose-5-phosphate isomerase n=1 Tax=Candidatus Doudnabacteria bacterium RIFCSPHIGHO2_01_FULL_50_11 TaxID=1817828 RepID=A0A1F5PMV3_9BACT|nr:MAG: hypothetical protein A2722_01810 [Candidatus Doudnabacteria bacterium RIFCSPHIGHO2_01_FULL_50_11]HLC44671.1 RpiB/LacA/LacB family sugar-phosphate isomerase [Patescibacteria group bacterium]